MDGNAADSTPVAAPRLAIAGVARWIAGVLLILYGFAKVNGSQFTVLDSELTRPMGEVGGFWLTWYHFGYSPIYGAIIALVQIVGGVLLVFPRTSLLAALVLLPVVGNIVLVDIFYGIPGGLPTAILVLVCLLVALAAHVRSLLDVVLPPHGAGPARAVRIAAIGMVVVVAYGFTWWVANYNNRHPTAIDGVWAVESDSRAGADAEPLARVFFEFNRAGLAVFRTAAGADSGRHFELDEDGEVRVWARWLDRSDLLMRGRYDPEQQVIDIESEEPGGGRLRLRRVSGPLTR